MKAAVLCNGPSRSAYNPDIEYTIRIGCNVPWTEVDCTVVLDEQLIQAWSKDKTIINCPVYFSEEAWRLVDSYKFRDYVNDNNLFKGLVKRSPGKSSGHIACDLAIEMGYKDIDIYGADAQFTGDIRGNIKSYTRKFVLESTNNNSGTWKMLWDQLVKKHKDIRFNFIKE